MKHLIGFIIGLMWLAGIVIAKGFWSTFFAIFFTPYSLYLTVEYMLGM